MSPEFEPRIISFCCNWCSYAGADLAGVSRIQYPTNIRIVRMMCSGRIDPVIVIETLAQGADGVMVLGCHLGDCHYIDGNYQAEYKMKVLKGLLAQTGLGAERVMLDWVSASEGARFAELVRSFTEKIRELGSSPLTGDKPDQRILDDVLAAKTTMEDFRLRLMTGRGKQMVKDGNSFGEPVSEEKLDEVIFEAVSSEYIRHKIHLWLKREPLSVRELAKRLDMDPRIVLRHIVMLRRRGMVGVDRIEGTSPLYTALEVAR